MNTPIVIDMDEEVRAPTTNEREHIIDECLEKVQHTPLRAKSVREKQHKKEKRERWAPVGLKHRHVCWSDYREMCHSVEKHFASAGKYRLVLLVRDLGPYDQHDCALQWSPVDHLSALVILQELLVRGVEARGQLIEALLQETPLELGCSAVWMQSIEAGRVERLPQHQCILSNCYTQRCEVVVPPTNKRK